MALSRVVILGAGPAGMGCAYTLAKAKQPSLVVEKDNALGGLCRTLSFSGYRFDIGGHRFLSKSEEINQFWQEVLNNDMLRVKRLSRIYYNKKYFNYPLSFFNVFWNLGLIESFLCTVNYLKCRYSNSGNNETFEGWTINHFGERLFDIFFKNFTEKVWDVPCQEISSDWARQRVQGLSLRVAIERALLSRRQSTPKTLAGEFFYPKLGSGEFYRSLKDKTSALGTQFAFSKIATCIKHNGEKAISLEVSDLYNNKREELPIDYLFSSIPLPILVRSLKPRPPENIIIAAGKLRFRSFLSVNIILNKEYVFSDQWIYVNCPSIKLARIQNYKNWSALMVADPKTTSLGLEYFCSEGDKLWRMNDRDLIQYALRELEEIEIISHRHFINGFVVRQPNAYPLYSLNYQKNVGIVRNYLDQFSNLQAIGRGGLFRYDNSDHALLTGIYAARNFLGEGSYDIWGVNTDESYF